MTIQYVYDQDGKATAVLVPIEEWGAIRRQLGKADAMTASDLDERKEAFEELERGEALDLHEAMRQW